jgi:hypothetical protein
LKRTDKIYIVIFLAITIFFLRVPLEFILLGKKTTGRVVLMTEKRSNSLKYRGSYYFAYVDVRIEGVNYRIRGAPNVVYPIGKRVTVVYFSGGSLEARIYDFKNLFTDKIVYIIFFLIIMIGMKVQFPRLFEPGGFEIFRK